MVATAIIFVFCTDITIDPTNQEHTVLSEVVRQTSS